MMRRTLQIGKPKESWSEQIVNHWPTRKSQVPLWWAIMSLGIILIIKRLSHYQILLLPSVWTQLSISPLGRLLGYKVIWITEGRNISGTTGKMIKKSANFVHAIIAPNQAQEVSYLRLGIGSSKIHLVYPPVVSKIQPSYLEPKTLVLAGDAAIEAEEGLGTLLRAASLARDILGHIKLILGGSLAGKSYLDWSSRQLNLTGCVQLSPGESDLWLEDAQVYILPATTNKAVPFSLAQAMFLGKALIASDKPNHREFVEQEKNGLLVPASEAEALSQAIIRLARQGDLLSRLSQSSHKFGQEHFAPEVFEAKLKTIIFD